MTDHKQPLVGIRKLIGIDSVGREFTIELAIGLPYQVGPSEWACPVILEGLHSRLRDVHGHDSFQALMLARQLAKQLLAAYVEDGGRLLETSGGNPVSVDALFDPGTLS